MSATELKKSTVARTSVNTGNELPTTNLFEGKIFYLTAGTVGSYVYTKGLWQPTNATKSYVDDAIAQAIFDLQQSISLSAFQFPVGYIFITINNTNPSTVS